MLYFLALLFFGKSFTNLPVIGPLYLHDAVLLLITVLAINRGKLVSRFNSIWILLAIAVLYLRHILTLFSSAGADIADGLPSIQSLPLHGMLAGNF